MLQQHGIASDQCWNNRVDGGDVRIIPGRNHQHNADWFTFDFPLETGLRAFGDNRREGFLCNVHHVANTRFKRAKLATITHRTAHLLRQFRHDFLVHCHHGIHESKGSCFALFERHFAPCLLRCPCIRQRLRNGSLGRDGLAHQFLAIDRGNAADEIGQGSLRQDFVITNSKGS
jgi:hypothetical protein